MSTIKPGMINPERINCENLKIARENAGYSTMEATKIVAKNKGNRDRVREWEQGESTPTWNQLMKLGDKYEVNYFLLLGNRKITRNREIKDYRKLDAASKSLNEKKFINLLLQRQGFLSYYLRANGSKNKLVGKLRAKKLSVADSANYIAEQLGCDYGEYSYKANEAGSRLKYFISLLEAKNIFVMKTLSYWPIDVPSMRGVFLNDEYAPIIALNRRDAKTAQLFTLAHELAHLFLAEEGVSNLEFRDASTNPVERRCNSIAAHLILPAELLEQREYVYQDIEKLASKYQVSPEFVFYRLDELHLFPAGNVQAIKQRVKKETQHRLKQRAEEEARRKQSGKTGGSSINAMKDSNGRLFTNFLLALYMEDKITPVEATNALRLALEQVL